MPAQSAAHRARLVEGATVLLGLAFIGARFPGPFAVLDNLSNFPAHFGIAFLACAALLAWRGRRAFAVGAAAAAILAFAPVLPWYAGGTAQPADAARHAVKMVVSNVQVHNRRVGPIQKLVAGEDPDVVGLIEVNERWLERLGQLRAQYPHYYEVPEETYAGLALYSRLPLTNARTLKLADSNLPAIAATLQAPGGEVELVLVHTSSPLDAGLIRSRNDQIRRLANFIREAGRPTVLAGDLNITMWNAGYRPLEEIARLHNARAGHGIGPTWPAIARFGVPIDHILATPDVSLRGFRVLRSVGSDHHPIAAEFALR